jgi:ribosomal protein S12 methylthiotransferase accessory factor
MSAPLFELRRPARKFAGSFDRTCSFSETLSHEAAICKYYGITRVAEITHLDRIGIPVFSSIVPESYDSISVYNGKGLTREAARAGAIMEAAERQAATIGAPAARIVDARFLDAEMQTLTRAQSVEVIDGYDLMNMRPAAVPISDVRSSNGLASGNTVAEAVYHALCELIERHVLSVAHAIAHERPREVIARFVGRHVDMPGFIDDAVATEYLPPTGSTVVDQLLDQIKAAGLDVTLRAVELQPFPMVFLATICDERGTVSRSHTGFGCSLTPEHAAIRAITEVAQGRLADIQAAREDLSAADDPTANDPHHQRVTSLPVGTWYFNAPARQATLPMLVDRGSDSISADVRTLLDILRSAGRRSAAIIDLSPATLPIAVVRAIVSDMETAIIDGAIGPTIATILDVTRSIKPIDLIVR